MASGEEQSGLEDIVRASTDPIGARRTFRHVMKSISEGDGSYCVVPLLDMESRAKFEVDGRLEVDDFHSAAYLYHRSPTLLGLGSRSGIEGVSDTDLYSLARDMVSNVQFDETINFSLDALLDRNVHRATPLLAAYMISHTNGGENEIPLFIFSSIFKEADDLVGFPKAAGQDLWAASTVHARSTGFAAAVYCELVRHGTPED